MGISTGMSCVHYITVIITKIWIGVTFIHAEALLHMQRCSVKKMFLRISQNSLQNTCARVSFLIKLRVFFCEYSEIFKNTYFEEQLRTVAPTSHPGVPPEGLTLGSWVPLFEYTFKCKLTVGIGSLFC